MNLSFCQENVSLAEKTYTKIGGVAKYFATPSNIQEVQQTVLYCKKNKIPCAVLGSGSNSVYADGLFDGVVLSLEKMNQWHWENFETLFVEPGVTNTEIAEICLAANRDGATWMYRMPGQIGGTIRMNARCYGGEISQIAVQILTINQNGELICYSDKEVFLGYKNTIFMNSPHIVVGVRLYFPKMQSANILLKHMLRCEQDRHEKHHFDFPSCGSTFKNNYDVGKSSGKIFDELGLKGTQLNSVAVSLFHGNFIWNFGQATSHDMFTLCSQMRKLAKNKLDINLDLEVQPVGCFDEELFINCGMENLGFYSKSNSQKVWVGLFYSPNIEMKQQQSSFTTIFSSFFVEYNQTPLHGMTPIFVKLSQLVSLAEAKKNPKMPFLKWETKCFENEKLIFNVKHPYSGYVDKLWNYSVSEIFFANSDKTENYIEFEMSPCKNWIHLKFNGVRNCVPIADQTQIEIYNEQQNNQFNFGMIFSYENLSGALGDGEKLLCQCALSLGNEKYFCAPYWKNLQKNKPDFHQPSKFWELNLF